MQVITGAFFEKTKPKTNLKKTKNTEGGKFSVEVTRKTLLQLYGRDVLDNSH